jgi:5'-methylthioadenosine nucleosidase
VSTKAPVNASAGDEIFTELKNAIGGVYRRMSFLAEGDNMLGYSEAMTHQTIQGKINRIAILYAMEAEGSPLADRLGLGAANEVHKGLPARVRQGKIASVEVFLLFNGIDPVHGVDRIGLEHAAVTTWALIEKFKPQLLINAGTCGGFQSRGATIGTTYLAGGDYLIHDHRIPLPGFQELGMSRIPTTRYRRVEERLGLSAGPISSGSSLDATESERLFFEKERVVAKDMEATAIARVAQDLQTPLLTMKAVTDLVDHPEPAQDAFLRNLRSTTMHLTDHMEQLVQWIGEGITHTELTS